MIQTVRVIAPPLPQGASVYIVGNREELGRWEPGAVPMERLDERTWAYTFRARRGSAYEFKLTRGAWDSEALDLKRRIPPNHRARVGDPDVLEIEVGGWRDLDTPAPSVVGDLRFHEGLGAPDVPSRTIGVWLPPGYEETPDRRYPVLYMHDGQNCFDSARSAFGMEWQIDEEATRLIAAGRMEPVIIVAIDNVGERRFIEYGDTPVGRAYRAYVVNVVKPFIDSQYRTLTGAAHTAVMGSSMGGCVSFLLAWERPDVFGQAACLSPAFFPPVHARVRKHRGPAPSIRLYFDNGGVGLERRLQPGIDKLRVLLAMRGFEEGRTLEWFLDPQAEHNENAWAARVWRPLEFLFGVRPE